MKDQQTQSETGAGRKAHRGEVGLLDASVFCLSHPAFTRAVLVAFALLLHASTPLANAAEPLAIRPLPRESGWSFAVAPYMWALSLDGDLTLRGNAAEVALSDKEILQNLQVVLMLSASVRKDRVGFFGDVVLAELEGDGAVGPFGRVSADVKLQLVDTKFGVDYLLGPYPLAAGSNAVQVTLAPYIAGRYFYIETDVTTSLPALQVEGSHSWMDPLIGVATGWDLSRHWNISLTGNVGGFGVGSDLSAEGMATLGYRFHFCRKVTGNVVAGYRAFYQDYSEGDFTYDATIHGPIVGLVIKF